MLLPCTHLGDTVGVAQAEFSVVTLQSVTSRSAAGEAAMLESQGKVLPEVPDNPAHYFPCSTPGPESLLPWPLEGQLKLTHSRWVVFTQQF